MSAAPQLAPAARTPGATPRPAASPRRPPPPALTRQLAARVGSQWLARAAWTVGRTGRPGLLGIALLLASAIFLLTTHLQVAEEVAALRAEQSTSRRPARAPAADAAASSASLPALPGRADVPEQLRQVFEIAARQRLAVDSGKFEVKTTGGGRVARHLVTFPVSGSYPQIRAFIDATLAAMPAMALGELSLARKAISDPQVEAQVRLMLYTDSAEPKVAPAGRPEAAALARVIEPTHAAALFAPHSWYVRPPPPPPPKAPPPPPPPEPTAPPFPYKLVGSYAPAGEQPVFFLARGDRAIDARVGDRIDGVYQFESAKGGQLVFLYLPLNIRQTLSPEASR
jgi:hypothetical protein